MKLITGNQITGYKQIVMSTLPVNQPDRTYLAGYLTGMYLFKSEKLKNHRGCISCTIIGQGKQFFSTKFGQLALQEPKSVSRNFIFKAMHYKN